uniref:Uncharacterized protein n=1 Tax=Trypanosoma congolense (strain IL3000) TaxID=1068625 RepID=G0UUL8_TRYCI|nr:conserved hypothetical protein [Trypanosoma congolense IL3000]
MLATSFHSEEDRFSQRLEYMNKEMKAIIDRTESERNYLLNMEVRNSMMKGFQGDHVVGGIHHSSLTSPFNSTPVAPIAAALNSSQELSEELAVRRLIDDRVNELRGSLAQMISEAISGINLTVQQRFSEAQKSRLDFTESLHETAEAARRSVGELHSTFSRMKRTVDRPIEELTRDLQDHVVRNNQENTRLRDSIASLENEVRVERQRGDRRVDELVRRHHDLVRNSLLELDSHVDGLRDEVQAMVRMQTRQILEELSSTQQQVARLNGALEAMNDTTVRCVSELRDLMDENVKRRAEVQSLRAEVETLTNLVKQSNAHDISTNRDNSFRRGEEGHSTNQNIPTSVAGNNEVAIALVNELKNTVNHLVNDVMRMGRHMASMDRALHTLFASTYGNHMGGGCFHSSGAERSNVKRGNGGGHLNDSLPMNSRTCSQFPLSPTGMSPTGVREQNERQWLGSRGHYNNGSPGYVPSAMNASQRPGSTTDGSPHSAFSPKKYPPAYNTGEAGHREFHAPGGYWDRHQPPRRVDNSDTTKMSQGFPHNAREAADNDGRTLAARDSPVARGSDSSRKKPSASQTSRGSPIKQTGATTAANVDSALLERAAPRLRPRSPTPSDSYVSPGKGAGWRVESRQYVPAPTSDLESELDNKKIARLALD